MSKYFILVLVVILAVRYFTAADNISTFFKVVDGKEIGMEIIENENELLIHLKLSIHSGELSENLEDFITVLHNENIVDIETMDYSQSGSSHHKEFKLLIPYTIGENHFEIDVLHNSDTLSKIDYKVKW